ncbi:hypothetical protein Ancab_019235 [Ancistrocladus abbreviatus]
MLSSEDQESGSTSCYSSKILESSLSLGRSQAITFNEKESGGPHVAITQGGNGGVRGEETSLLSGCGDYQRMAGLNEHSMKRQVDEGKVASEASQTQNTPANDQDGGPPMDQARRLLGLSNAAQYQKKCGSRGKRRKAKTRAKACRIPKALSMKLEINKTQDMSTTKSRKSHRIGRTTMKQSLMAKVRMEGDQSPIVLFRA